MKAYHRRDKGIGITFDDIWIVNGARTGMGRYTGTLARVSPTDLGIFAAREALKRSGISPDEIDQVIFSNITQSSLDAYYLPRHVGIYSGIPQTVPALLVQRLCGTGFQVAVSAAEEITLGKADRVLAGAAENMTLSPTVSYGLRMGHPMGQVPFHDFLSESLKDSATGGHMGCTAENLVRKYNITREEADLFAKRSQDLALAAAERLREEMVALNSTVFEAEGLNPRKVRLPRGVENFAADETVRATSLEKISTLKPVFEQDGVQTAANSSGIVDGAAALVISRGGSGGNVPLTRMVAATTAGVDPHIMGIGPVPAIQILLELTGMSLEQIGLIEINEAFAGQVIACERALGIDRNKLNVNGGAIALGHPLSATGSRILLSLSMEMRRRRVKYGIASACIGGGQGMAVLLENPEA